MTRASGGRRRALAGLAAAVAAIAGAAAWSGGQTPRGAEGAIGASREPATAMSAGSGPFDIAAGPDGNLWFTQVDEGNRIGRITPAGIVTEFTAGISRGAAPLGIAAGPDGNLWFTEAEGDRVGRITPAGAVTEFTAGISRRSAPAGIAAGPDGNLWFTESAGDRIGRITPGGVVTEFAAGISRGAGPLGIATGPDGNLWFTEAEGDRIGRITPAGAVTEFPLRGRPGGQPSDIAAGPDDNLWFTEAGRSRIGRITPDGAVAEFPTGLRTGAPCGIAAGPDGNLWFTEAEGNRVGRITPAGAVTVFRGPTPYVHHETSEGTWYSRCGIVAGPDGNLWFTEWEADRIARVTPRGVISEYPPTAAVLRIGQRGASAVAVRLRCPPGAVRDCRGTLRLHALHALSGRPRRVGVRRFALAPAARADLVVPLWAAGRRQLRRWRVLPLDVVLVPSAHGLAGAAHRELVMRLPPRKR